MCGSARFSQREQGASIEKSSPPTAVLFANPIICPLSALHFPAYTATQYEGMLGLSRVARRPAFALGESGVRERMRASCAHKVLSGMYARLQIVASALGG